MVTTLRFEEIVAEKIRAAYQRLTVRDVYDLYQFRQDVIGYPRETHVFPIITFRKRRL